MGGGGVGAKGGAMDGWGGGGVGAKGGAMDETPRRGYGKPYSGQLLSVDIEQSGSTLR